MPRGILSLLLLALCLVLVACDDGEGDTARPTSAPGTAGATRAPPIEGTIDPMGGGSTGPETVRPSPDPLTSVPVLTDVRVGAHPEQGGWDRIVFQFRDSLPGARIEYVSSVVQC